MKKSIWVFTLSLMLLSFSCNKKVRTSAEITSDETAIMGANVIPMTGDQKILKNQTIIIKNGKIHQIGPASEVKPSKGAQKIKADGQFLMPGLTEMHAHIPVANNGDDSYVKETLFLYLSQGVTTIRGMLGNPYHLALKKQIEEETILSPRVYTSSPSMNGNSVTSIGQAEEKVRQYKTDGYDFLKIHPGIQLEVMQQLVTTAQEIGMPFSGHVPAAVGIRNALNYKYATIDHLDGYVTGMAPEGSNADQGGFFGYEFTDEAKKERMRELVQMTKEKGVAVVPTQTLFTRWMSPKNPAAMTNEPEMKYMPAKVRYQWRQSKENLISSPTYTEEKHARFVALRANLMKEMYDSGVQFLSGSDAPQVFNVPGFSLLHELEDMAAAGLPNDYILETSTTAPASFFSSTGQYGVIQKGASADLILLSANPLDDIGNIRKQEGVMVRGRWLSKEMIAAKLAEIAEKNQG